MITYPTTSNALESFVLDRAEESTHSAMLVRTPDSRTGRVSLQGRLSGSCNPPSETLRPLEPPTQALS